MVKSGGGGSKFPSITFCLRWPKHLAEEPLCVVFQKISGRKMFMDKWGAGGREYHQFPSDFFYLTVPKNSVVEPFSV